MNETQPTSDQGSEEWAPHDYTDGRPRGEWKTFYPPEARKWILIEALYLILLFFACLSAVFYIVYELCPPAQTGGSTVTQDQTCATFLGYIGAWIAGMLGGCSFGIKWMYHSVAKRIWHEDRRLWRLLSPHLSGVVALFMVFLVSSGLLQLFDKDFIQRAIAVMAFSFLVGYFSDKALAKMAEVADTLFGAEQKKKADQAK
jgi:NhaP-type Na+/H+ or K+/H+ antiporter